MRARSLKIEATGDFHARKIKPMIRLCGRWLEQAGFRPGARVRIEFTTSGQMVLTSEDLMKKDEPDSALESDRERIMARLDQATKVAEGLI